MVQRLCSRLTALSRYINFILLLSMLLYACCLFVGQFLLYMLHFGNSTWKALHIHTLHFSFFSIGRLIGSEDCFWNDQDSVWHFKTLFSHSWLEFWYRCIIVFLDLVYSCQLTAPVINELCFRDICFDLVLLCLILTFAIFDSALPWFWWFPLRVVGKH